MLYSHVICFLLFQCYPKGQMTETQAPLLLSLFATYVCDEQS